MGEFRVIAADNPWSFGDRLRMSKVARGAEANYPVMTMGELEDLDIARVAADDSVLALWVPASLLSSGLSVMASWGFAQKQVYVWGKTTAGGGLSFGMGRLFRGAHELALIGTRGSPYRYLKSRSERNLSLAPNAGHSIKPPNLYEALERMFEGPKLELFGRKPREGWTVLGNEVTGNDIREDLDLLCKF